MPLAGLTAPGLNAVPRPASAERPDLPPWENELIARVIQEIRDALEAFKTAVQAGEMTGYKHSEMRGAW